MKGSEWDWAEARGRAAIARMATNSELGSRLGEQEKQDWTCWRGLELVRETFTARSWLGIDGWRRPNGRISGGGGSDKASSRSIHVNSDVGQAFRRVKNEE